MSHPASQISVEAVREVCVALRATGHDNAAEEVELRFGLQRACLICDGEIPATRYRSAKFCSRRCRDISNRKQWNEEKAEHQRRWRAKRKAAANA